MMGSTFQGWQEGEVVRSGRAYSQIHLSIGCKYSFSKTTIPYGSDNMPNEGGMAMMALVHSKDDKKARVAAGQARQARQAAPAAVSTFPQVLLVTPVPLPTLLSLLHLLLRSTLLLPQKKNLHLLLRWTPFLCQRKVFVGVSHCWYKSHQPWSTSAMKAFLPDRNMKEEKILSKRHQSVLDVSNVTQTRST